MGVLYSCDICGTLLREMDPCFRVVVTQKTKGDQGKSLHSAYLCKKCVSPINIYLIDKKNRESLVVKDDKSRNESPDH